MQEPKMRSIFASLPKDPANFKPIELSNLRFFSIMPTRSLSFRAMIRSNASEQVLMSLTFVAYAKYTYTRYKYRVPTANTS